MPDLSTLAADCRRPPFRVDELVLEVVNGSSRALGAYEIASQLTASGRRVAATQAYRSLHRLVADRRIGKVEGLNAYCRLGGRAGPVIFCRMCRRFVVSDRDDLVERAAEAASKLGFLVRRIVAEVDGTCAACSAGSVRP